MPFNRLFGSRSRVGISILVVCLLIGGYAGWRYLPAHGDADATKKQARGPAPIPVTVKTAQETDFPVYLNGLGTVQPYNTVTVKSRVDGEVIKVNFRQGDMVKEGDLLVQIDPRPYQAALDQALAKKAQDEANLKNAQLNLERSTTLAQKDVTSKQTLDAQQAMVDQLIAQVKADQAAIDNAQTQLGYTTIKSPLTGKTGFRLVDRGNIVHASDTGGIVSIVKLQPISVVFTAPEENVGAINSALANGEVKVTALTSDGTRTIAQGHLGLVNNSVDAASGTIQMKATFQNADNALWPGLSVSTRLLLETKHKAIVVPNDAVQHGPAGLYAYVVGADRKAHKQDIKVSDESASTTLVSDGLKAGDRVVVAGQYRLTDGALADARDQDAPAEPGKDPNKQANAAAQAQ